jgi:hypothetical protein
MIPREHFTDPDVFFEAVRAYATEIRGTVLCADEVPYLGFTVFVDGVVENDKGKHFLLHVRHLRGWKPPGMVRRALQTNEGRRVLARSLEPSP